MKSKLLFTMLFITSVAFSQVIYVNQNATGNNSGTSWANAYTELADALGNVPIGAEIWIARGVYRPNDDDPSLISRDDSFFFNQRGLNVYGGFAGTEATKSDRDFTLIHTTNAVILSGDLDRNDNGLVSFGNATFNNNSHSVVTVSDNTISINDLTITAANANIFTSSNIARKNGGAIYAQPNTIGLSVNNVIFKDNIAEVGAGISYFPANNATLNINSCVFENNLSRHSTGVYIAPQAGVTLDVEITNSLFVDNKTEDLPSVARNGLGGAAGWIRSFYNGTTVNAKIVNNTFVNNTNIGSSTTSDYPVLGCSKPSTTTSVLNVTTANNIFWGNRKNNNSIARPFGFMVDDTFIPGSSVYNSIDEVGFSNMSGMINTSGSNPNLTSDYKLQASSTAAIDQGDNSFIPTNVTLDLAGNSRVENTTVDIGAYEFPAANSCIVSIPDANFKAALVANTSVNTNGNSEIECSEASAFSGILTVGSTSRNISDLTGIEAFTNLTGLRCMDNQITTIDMSQNLALEILWFSRNNVSTLDVSQNTNLRELVGFDNQLTSIDVSQNTALTVLSVLNNQLTSLDVSTNTALNELYCQGNLITSLNLTNNTALQTLYCYDNQLTNLDLSNNTALTEARCYNNQLTSFTPSTSLVSLSVAGNQLSSIDLSQNLVLEEFFAADNSFTSLDISANPALTNLICFDNNQLTELNVANGNNANMRMQAYNSSNLRCIEHDTGFDPETANNWRKDATARWSSDCNAPCIVTIPDAIFKAALVGNSAINTNGNTEIECDEAVAYTGSINVSALNISDFTGLEAFTAATEIDFSQNSVITSIDFSFTNSFTSINGFNASALTNIDISGAFNLDVINLAQCNLTSLNTTNNNVLRVLTLTLNSISSLNLIDNYDLEILTAPSNNLSSLDVSQNTSLRIINVTDNNLSSLNIANGNNSSFITMWANANPALGCIQIDSGFTPPAGWRKDATASYSDACTACTVNIPDTNLKAALLANVTLNLNGNSEIECSEASAFSGALDISVNGITDLTGIETLTGMTELYCENNQITSLNLSQNTALEVLWFMNNTVANIDLSQNLKLEELVGYNNQLTSLDVSQNTALTILSVYDNQINVLDVSQNDALLELYCQNNQLTELNISNGNNMLLNVLDAESNPGLACIQIDSGFTPPAGWSKDVTASYSDDCSLLSVNDLFTIDFELYPNPASNTISISTDEELKSIEIYTLLGERINYMDTDLKSIDISALSNGVYFIKIKTTKDAEQILRFVKQ